MPALPLDEAGRYVAAAYIVFVALILIYVAIMASKIQRINRDLDDLTDLAERNTQRRAGASDEVPGQPGRRTPSESAESPAGTRDEVPGRAAEPAAPLAPQPDGPGRGAPEARSGGAGGGIVE